MSGKRLRHRKLFRPGQSPDDLIEGCNINCSDICWGSFIVMQDTRSAVNIGDDKPVTCISYDVMKNGRLTRRIRDYIRTTSDPNVMIGKFYVKWRGKYRFKGFFTLTRIKAA
jgi:hypothetical protein